MRRYVYLAEHSANGATVTIIPMRNYNTFYAPTDKTKSVAIHIAGTRKNECIFGKTASTDTANRNLLATTNIAKFVSMPLALAFVKYDESNPSNYRYLKGEPVYFHGIIRRKTISGAQVMHYAAKLYGNGQPKAK